MNVLNRFSVSVRDALRSLQIFGGDFGYLRGKNVSTLMNSGGAGGDVSEIRDLPILD